jgi:acyl transferase domain-containing protein
VKTNIGHCEAAAGIAGLIKVALAIHHGRIPPNLHFARPNPHIPFEAAPLAVPTATTQWHGRRLAGVSSFGFGGTNAHIVLEAPQVVSRELNPPQPEAERVHLLPLSAATRPALEAVARRVDDCIASLDQIGSAQLADLCQAAATRRTHFDHRAALRFRNVGELRDQLAALGSGQPHLAVSVGKRVCDRRPKVAFIFSGQGGQWHGMHRPLCSRFSEFRAKLQECDALIREHAGWSLLAELEAEPSQSGIDGGVEVVQTSLFAFQVALAEAWRAWGIEPDAVAGHSMGEVAAACVAGGLALPDAVRVIVHRSRLLEQALEEIGDAGGMAALRISAEEAEQLIEGCRDRVWIAVHNSPKYTVLSGDLRVLQELLEKLRKRKVGGRIMNVPGAAHTPLLQSTGAKLEAVLDGLQPRSPVVPFYSTLTGRRHTQAELDAHYWGKSVCRTVRFAPAIDQLHDDGYGIFIELGPHPLLTAAIAQCADHRGCQAAALPSLRREDRDLEAMLESFGALYTHGVDVDWRQIDPVRRSWVSLPTYPWQRQRCWIDPPRNGRNGVPQSVPQTNPLLMKPLDTPADEEPTAQIGAPATGSSPSGLCRADGDVSQELHRAPLEKRREILEDYLRCQIAHTLGTDPERIDVQQSLTTLGIDSLMAIETKNRVEAELGLEVQLVQFLEGPTVARLADALLPQLDRCASSGNGADRADSGVNPVEIAEEEAQRLLERVDQLSDEEIDALMHRMFAE